MTFVDEAPPHPDDVVFDGGLVPNEGTSTDPDPSPIPSPSTTTDPTDVGDPVAEAAAEADRRLGEEILRDKLREYGLEELIPWAFEQLRLDFSAETIILRLADQEAFKKRFAGLELLRQNGYNQKTVAQYLQIENEMAQNLATAGLPVGFYDDPSDFAEWIGNNVSSDEHAERINLAITAIASVNPELKAQLIELYGVGADGDGDLIAYYLDPDRAVPLFEQRLQMEAAGLSAASVRTLGGGLKSSTAEQLADANVQDREISDRLRGQAGLVNTRLLGETSVVSANEVVQAEFGFSQDATDKIRRLRNRRQESAKRVSGALATAAGATGLGSAATQG